MSKHVVYMIDEDGEPLPKFLAVCDDADERDEEMERWWKAFHNGEKATPENYGGISHAPVAEFDDWRAPADFE